MFAILSYSTSQNLGDEVQSISAFNLLQKYGISRVENMDRDTHILSACPINLIMNGWFDGNYSKWPPPLGVHPLFISFHINEQPKTIDYLAIEQYKKEFTSLADPKYLEYYNKFLPIRCRDNHTVRLLKEIGVNAEFSGCLTMTLKSDYQGERYGIYIVDVEPESFNDIPSDIRDKATYITHVYTGPNRIIESNSLLETYKRAKLVITSRLHCALPCVAFDTPVIFMFKNWKNDCRFDGLIDFLPTCGKDSINWYSHKNKDKTAFNQLAKNMENIVKEWINVNKSN